MERRRSSIAKPAIPAAAITAAIVAYMVPPSAHPALHEAASGMETAGELDLGLNRR